MISEQEFTRFCQSILRVETVRLCITHFDVSLLIVVSASRASLFMQLREGYLLLQVNETVKDFISILFVILRP